MTDRLRHLSQSVNKGVAVDADGATIAEEAGTAALAGPAPDRGLRDAGQLGGVGTGDEGGHAGHSITACGSSTNGKIKVSGTVSPRRLDHRPLRDVG